MSPISWKIRARSPFVRSPARSAASSAWRSAWAIAVGVPVSSTGSATRASSARGADEDVLARRGTERWYRGGRPRTVRSTDGRVREAERCWVRILGGDDAVPAATLGIVERAVCVLDHFVDRRVGILADRGTHRDADAWHAQPREIEPSDGRAHSLADLDRHRSRWVAQQDGELLATIARRDVVLTDRPHDRAGDRPEDLVADLMAEPVVEVLELVDVDHQDADRVLGPATPCEERAELVEIATVREPGQAVRGRAGLGLAMRVGA